MTPAGRGGAAVDVALAVPVRRGRVLVARRPPGVPLAGLWEFPGGKVERGEEPSAAARRELLEETGMAAVRLDPLVVVLHEYDGRPFRLHAFLAPEPEGEVRAGTGRDWSWTDPGDLAGLAMPAANGPIVRALLRRVRATPR